MWNTNLELFAITKSESFAVLGNDPESLHSCSDFHTGEQSPSLPIEQLSLLYKRDDDAASLQSLGKKISKEMTFPQEKTVFFKGAGVVSFQVRSFSALLLLSAGRMAQPQEQQGCSQITRLFSLPLLSLPFRQQHHRVWLPSPAAVTAFRLHPKDPVVG